MLRSIRRSTIRWPGRRPARCRDGSAGRHAASERAELSAAFARSGPGNSATGPAAAVLSVGNAVGFRGTRAGPRSAVDGAPADWPPVAPPQARKVARFVTAEAAQSTLKLAADGQLPQLQLQDTDEHNKGQGKARSIPPLVMILAWLFPWRSPS